MYTNTNEMRIESAIESFANAYQALGDLQNIESKKDPSERLLPIRGDQKTGLIREYWAVRYARSLFPRSKLEFVGHSQKGWDLKLAVVDQPPATFKVKPLQSSARKLSTICLPSRLPTLEGEKELHDYWNDQWLLSLNKYFRPALLLKMKPEHVDSSGADCPSNKTLRRDPTKPNTGSKCFGWERAECITDLRGSFRSA